MHNVVNNPRDISTVRTNRHSVSYHKKYPTDEHPVELYVTVHYNGKMQRVVDGKKFDTEEAAKQYAYERGWIRRYVYRGLEEGGETLEANIDRYE